MREPDNISQVMDINPDYMGFIFYQGSKRYVNDIDSEALKKIPSGIRKTGVFVDSSFEDITAAINKYHLDAVQLHGEESPELCRRLKQEGIEVIKAFGINNDFDFTVLEEYTMVTDHFLFDTKTSSHGGSGKVFDWKSLEKYPYQTTYFLSGGLSLDNIEDIQHIEDKRLYAIDINSKFESEPGIKDVEKIKKAINYIRLKKK
ncbi:MAG TPA: N-(5'-phosphoribosyl)anthranilate isomerase [Sphingobacteriaceae bacterium]|nr:N-(5'-phosphoribosyl)anthranilate isomerase [Sphingobacteriaceae bacterium]